MSTYIVGVPYHIFAFSDFTALRGDGHSNHIRQSLLQFLSPGAKFTMGTRPGVDYTV